MGANKERHRIENKHCQIARHEDQSERSYWMEHRGQFSVPPEKEGPKKYRGQMCPRGLALHHPAAAVLLDYATGGCPVKTGKPWTREEIVAAVERGPHVSALVPEAMEQFASEVWEKERKGQCRVVLWDDIKDNPPE